MVKEEFTYDSRDGKSQLHAVRYLPDENVEIRGVIQIVHGMAEYIERYEELAGFLTEKGFVVTGEDHLGHGRSVGKRGRYGYFCEQDPATVMVRDVQAEENDTTSLPKSSVCAYRSQYGVFSCKKLYVPLRNRYQWCHFNGYRYADSGLPDAL